MDSPNWVIAGGSILNVIVLIAYAWFTWGIWSETQRSVNRTAELAQVTRDALVLQAVLAYRDLANRIAASRREGREGLHDFRHQLGQLRELFINTLPSVSARLGDILDWGPD